MKGYSEEGSDVACSRNLYEESDMSCTNIQALLPIVAHSKHWG